MSDDLMKEADAKLAQNEIELLGCYDVHPEPYENDPEAPEARRAFLENLLAPFLARIRELEDRCGRYWGMVDAKTGVLNEANDRIRKLEAQLATARDDAVEEAHDLIQRVADGYAGGGDGAIACALYLTAGNVRALKGGDA